jgi:hypothetical protein
VWAGFGELRVESCKASSSPVIDRSRDWCATRGIVVKNESCVDEQLAVRRGRSA